MGTSPYLRDPQVHAEAQQWAMPPLVLAFFVTDIVVVVAALISFAVSRQIGVEPPGFFRLGQESNLPTWFATVQHALIALLLGCLAIREIRTDPRRWGIALPALMFLSFSFDEVAMIHERLANWMSAHSGFNADHGLTNSAPAMILLLPAAILTTIVSARLTRRYWQGRAGVAIRFIVGTGMFLLCAGGLEIAVNLVRDNELLVKLGSLVEETGEMIGTTIVLWSVLELLAAERFTVSFDRHGVHFA